MIRKIALYTASLLFVAGCAANNGFQTTQTFVPAQFQVSDVYVNMADGVENSNRLRGLMRNAGKNTASVYNDAMGSVSAEYPLEIEVTDVNYRDPNASAASGDRTYIRYTATLREEASGEVFRSLPVTYYHVTAEKLDNSQAKQNAEKNMIRLSLKNAFARLYGMQEVPQSVQRHFATQDIFSQSDQRKTKPEIKPQKKGAPAPVVASVVPTQPAVQPTPEPVIAAPDEAITETTTQDGATVIKCVVC
jgi:hypothetical protein